MMENAENSKMLIQWFNLVMQGIVAHPEAIDIRETKDDMGVLFVVKVHKEDRGRVIGSKGKNADALRTILRSAGGNVDVRVALKIDVPR